MEFGFSSLIFIFYSLLLLLQCLQSTEGHLKNMDIHEADQKDNHLRFRGNPGKNSPSLDHMDPELDPELNVFFHHKDLELGNKIKIYFPIKDPSTSPHLLSKHESDSIPFASSKLNYILVLFSFPQGSKQAKAMETTLHHCEYPPLKGETKFCATSLEQMLDSLREIFAPNPRFKVLTTNYLSDEITPLQMYKIRERPVEIAAPKIVACHTLPYPYAVFYCHSQASDNVLYKVMIEGEDGGRVDATAMCHMDTSQWDPNHVAFRVLGTSPGEGPVCHFFPADNLVWIPGP